MNISMLIGSIRMHEGLSLVPYKDTEGHLTIGYGHNLDAGISLRQAYLLLDSDIETCMLELDKGFPGWREHPDHVQNVLLEMQFNLGRPRLAKFQKMWAALNNDDYETAAKEMLNSKWAKQVGQRAQTLAKQMAEGFPRCSEKEQEVIDMLNELIRLFGEMQAILDDLTKRHEAAINGR